LIENPARGDDWGKAMKNIQKLKRPQPQARSLRTTSREMNQATGDEFEREDMGIAAKE
jgi:hypothetical protein